MRAYWDDRARENAMWFVDTSLQYDDPDEDRFWAAGETIAARVVDASPVAIGGRGQAVEIGCGLGRICAALATRFDRVVGVDISPSMVDQARAAVTTDGMTFVVGDGASLTGVDDTSTDLVVSYTVFQHIPDPAVIAAYLAEARRVLRPDGVVAFQWNNEPGDLRWRVRRSVLAFLQRTGIRPERRGRNAAEFLGSRVSRRRMARMLDDAGLALAATDGDGTLFAWAWAVPKT